MNLNQLAKQITLREGLKKQVNIAQVKEILRVIVDMEVDAQHCQPIYSSSYYVASSPVLAILRAVMHRLKKLNKTKKKKKTKKAKRK